MNRVVPTDQANELILMESNIMDHSLWTKKNYSIIQENKEIIKVFHEALITTPLDTVAYGEKSSDMDTLLEISQTSSISIIHTGDVIGIRCSEADHIHQQRPSSPNVISVEACSNVAVSPLNKAPFVNPMDLLATAAHMVRTETWSTVSEITMSDVEAVNVSSISSSTPEENELDKADTHSSLEGVAISLTNDKDNDGLFSKVDVARDSNVLICRGTTSDVATGHLAFVDNEVPIDEGLPVSCGQRGILPLQSVKAKGDPIEIKNSITIALDRCIMVNAKQLLHSCSFECYPVVLSINTKQSCFDQTLSVAAFIDLEYWLKEDNSEASENTVDDYTIARDRIWRELREMLSGDYAYACSNQTVVNAINAVAVDDDIDHQDLSLADVTEYKFESEDDLKAKGNVQMDAVAESSITSTEMVQGGQLQYFYVSDDEAIISHVRAEENIDGADSITVPRAFQRDMANSQINGNTTTSNVVEVDPEVIAIPLVSSQSNHDNCNGQSNKERETEESDSYQRLWHQRKAHLEKRAEERAKVRFYQWQRDERTLEDIIDGSLKEYIDLYESAHALRLQFEAEKAKWTSKIMQVIASNNRASNVFNDPQAFQYFLVDSGDEGHSDHGEESNDGTSSVFPKLKRQKIDLSQANERHDSVNNIQQQHSSSIFAVKKKFCPPVIHSKHTTTNSK